MKYLLYIAVIALMTACIGMSPKSEPVDNDSIQQAIKDSIAKAHNDSIIKAQQDSIDRINRKAFADSIDRAIKQSEELRFQKFMSLVESANRKIQGGSNKRNVYNTLYKELLEIYKEDTDLYIFFEDEIWNEGSLEEFYEEHFKHDEDMEEYYREKFGVFDY